MPTVSTDDIIATLVIDMNENRDVSITDVVDAYLNTNMDDFVAIKIEGMMVDYMVKADPQMYSKYLWTYNNNKVLYVRIVNALYG